MPRWDRFDICQAWYLFAMDYHRGQWSKEYEIFGRLHRMGFKPGHGFCRKNIDRAREEYQNTRDILASLIRRYRRKGM